MSQLLVNKDNWPLVSSRLASPSDPEDYNDAACERLMEFINPWVVDVKNIRPQFKAFNKILMIDFESQAERDYYNQAYERYLEEVGKIKARGDEGAASNFAVLVEWLKFRQAAEFTRRKYLARRMYHAVQEGYSAISASNFKATIAGIVLELHKTYKVPRGAISLIWGGDRIYVGEKEKYSLEDMQDILKRVMLGDDIPKSVLNEIKRQLQASNAGLVDIPSYLNLGPQTLAARQDEIDRFQLGNSLYCCFNFKSGGVGLSLHHSDELTKEKCRRKDNGYVYLDDILSIPTRPRCSFLAPTYSAIELVQGLGRAPRIASLSDTMQTLVFYRGTVETSVAAVTSAKLKCLTKIVRQREDWSDLILNSHRDKQTVIVPDEETIDGKELFELDNIEDNDENDDD